MIRIENIMPHPLVAFPHGERSIWGQTFSINFKDLTLLNASSGKGKTTFISILFGLRKDYEGSAYVYDKNLHDFRADDWTRLRRDTFSIVFQDLQLLPQLTLEENLKIKFDLGSDLSFDAVLHWIELLGLGDKTSQKAGTLSYGQQQRVAIVRALIPRFEYLMMDEPFSHLDEVNTQLALDLILNRCKQLNTGCLLSTLGETYGNQFNKMLYL